jgi:hypothetical protein
MLFFAIVDTVALDHQHDWQAVNRLVAMRKDPEPCFIFGMSVAFYASQV